VNLLAENHLISRYLPLIPEGIATDWIELHALKGKFILDPFGAAPDLSTSAALLGLRIIVAANNPIARLLIEVTANPPTSGDLRNAISALSAVRVRDERLEPHISALYHTSCPNCETLLAAEAFIWEREAEVPYARIIRCNDCDTTGEFPVTESDLRKARKFSKGGLHYSRALERVAPLNDPDRVHVEEALNVFPPRAIYALQTIVNKLDLLKIPPAEEKFLFAILLNVFDRANTLWAHPIARERPRQLTIPPIYRENNVWLALENAAKQWQSQPISVPITYWPVLPSDEGGICIFEGPIRELAQQISDIEISAILTAFPRPNQAFWSLSALWAGWLWGHGAVEHFKSVLRRRRYDWAWHTTAILAALESIKPALSDDLPFLGFISEAEPGFTGAVTVAASQAGFQFENITMWPDKKLVQILWQTASPVKPTAPSKIEEIIEKAARDYLNQRGEPCSYLQLHTAILEALGQRNAFPREDSPSGSYTQTQQEIQSILDFRHGFLRYAGSEKSIEVGQWWLVDDANVEVPLADRAEIAVVQYLLQNPGCSPEECKKGIRIQFPGLLYPETKLIQECLESYGEQKGACWQLREEDDPMKRRAELSMMLFAISELGENLGFRVQSSEQDVSQSNVLTSIWSTKNRKNRYTFFFSASALLGKYLVKQQPAPTRGIIVMPGGRANLAMFKLHRDPRLQKIFEQGWQFLKFRQARQLAQNTTLTAETLESQLDLDPLTYAETQMRMF